MFITLKNNVTFTNLTDKEGLTRETSTSSNLKHAGLACNEPMTVLP